MIPKASDIVIESETEETLPSLTYSISGDHIRGFLDGEDAVRQMIFCTLNAERYKHPVYSWDTGVEFSDLIGEDPDYCIAEIERRVTEALEEDDRIDSVDDFEFEVEESKISCTFTVSTVFGEIESEVEVNV